MKIQKSTFHGCGVDQIVVFLQEKTEKKKLDVKSVEPLI